MHLACQGDEDEDELESLMMILGCEPFEILGFSWFISTECRYLNHLSPFSRKKEKKYCHLSIIFRTLECKPENFKTNFSFKTLVMFEL